MATYRPFGKFALRLEGDSGTSSAGVALTGQTVQLKQGSNTYDLIEVTNDLGQGVGTYKVDSIYSGKYLLWVNGSATSQLISVGVGDLDNIGFDEGKFVLSGLGEWFFKTVAEVKALLGISNVTDVALPTPTAADNGKVLGVSGGNFAIVPFDLSVGASDVSLTPFTGVSSTNVQDGIEEVYSESARNTHKEQHYAGGSDAVVQNSLTASTTLAPTVSAVNAGLNDKVSKTDTIAQTVISSLVSSRASGSIGLGAQTTGDTYPRICFTSDGGLNISTNGTSATHAISQDEIKYLDGVTSDIQTQLNGKSDIGHTHSDYVSKSTTTAQTLASQLDVTRSSGSSGLSVRATGDSVPRLNVLTDGSINVSTTGAAVTNTISQSELLTIDGARMMAKKTTSGNYTITTENYLSIRNVTDPAYLPTGEYRWTGRKVTIANHAGGSSPASINGTIRRASGASVSLITDLQPTYTSTFIFDGTEWQEFLEKY